MENAALLWKGAGMMMESNCHRELSHNKIGKMVRGDVEKCGFPGR